MHAHLSRKCSSLCVSGLQVPGPDSQYVQELGRLARWVGAQRRKGRLPPIVWMDTPPQHFPVSGYWTGAFRAPGCAPLDAWRRGAAVERRGGTWNVAAAPLLEQLADARLGIWNASAELWDSHVPGECTHW